MLRLARVARLHKHVARALEKVRVRVRVRALEKVLDNAMPTWLQWKIPTCLQWRRCSMRYLSVTHTVLDVLPYLEWTSQTTPKPSLGLRYGALITAPTTLPRRAKARWRLAVVAAQAAPLLVALALALALVQALAQPLVPTG